MRCKHDIKVKVLLCYRLKMTFADQEHVIALSLKKISIGECATKDQVFCAQYDT